MTTKMKPSEKAALIALVVGVLAAGGLWWFLPGMHWAVYAVVGVLVASGWYSADIDFEAKKKIIDGDLDR